MRQKRNNSQKDNDLNLTSPVPMALPTAMNWRCQLFRPRCRPSPPDRSFCEPSNDELASALSDAFFSSAPAGAPLTLEGCSSPTHARTDGYEVMFRRAEVESRLTRRAD